jgi:hypothetical protein
MSSLLSRDDLIANTLCSLGQASCAVCSLPTFAPCSVGLAAVEQANAEAGGEVRPTHNAHVRGQLAFNSAT